MKILKNLFGTKTKIATSEISDLLGVPLDDLIIIDFGKNEKGSWVKFGNGFMITYSNFIKASSEYTSQGFNSQNITINQYSMTYMYPQTFTYVPTVLYNGNADSSNAVMQSFKAFGNSTDRVTLAVASIGTISPNIRNNVVCFGRWK